MWEQTDWGGWRMSHPKPRTPEVETRVQEEDELPYRAIIENLSEGIVIRDAGGKIVAANAAAEDILGVARDRLIGSNFSDQPWTPLREDSSLWPVEAQPTMVTLRTGERQANVVMGILRPDESRVWISATSLSVDLPYPHEGRGVVCVFADIAATREALRALALSEARFRSLTQLSSDWYWEMDMELRFTYVSDGIKRVRGVEPSSLIGRRRWELEPLEVDEEMARHRSVVEAHLPFRDFVYPRRRPDGSINYQPKVDLKTGRIVGSAALIRWMHPTRGTIPPLQFIPLAEETGLIRQMTYGIIESAVRQQHAWAQRSLMLPTAVNLSVRNLYDPRLIDAFIEQISTWGVDPRLIDFEITESAVVDDPESAKQVLSLLRQKGSSLYIDDFGTGYSSLNYLVSLPVHFLKIDRSFVTQMKARKEARAVVASVISMAHNLGLKVVAEGVETQEEADTLKALECDQGQGYLFHKPLPPSEFQKLFH